MNFKIIFEDEHIIVCYKPAGIPTQTSKLGEQDMVSLLKNYLAQKPQATNNKIPYLAVIHRLDQPVEGLLVFAKTPFAAKELSKQVQGLADGKQVQGLADGKQVQNKQGSEHMQTTENAGFGKYYKAMLWGIPEKASATLENHLVKDGRTNTSHVCDKNEKDAKKALLYYEVLAVGKEKGQSGEKGSGADENVQNNTESGNDISLVKIKLATGRHHQIRVQMAHIGCPIWGDAKYNTASLQDRRFRQIALCAYKLEFVHPKTKKPMEFEIEPEGEGFRKLSLHR